MFGRKTSGYTWTDRKRNLEIAKELNLTPVLGKIQEYIRNWLQHIRRTLRGRLGRVLKKLQTKGRRN